jgi:hypothetical protein
MVQVLLARDVGWHRDPWPSPCAASMAATTWSQISALRDGSTLGQPGRARPAEAAADTVASIEAGADSLVSGFWSATRSEPVKPE